MIVRCQLRADEIGRYFPNNLRNKVLTGTKNNTNDKIVIKVTKGYIKSSIGSVDKVVHYRPQEQNNDYLGIDKQLFLIDILEGSVIEGDIINIEEDNNLYVYELTDYL